MNGDNWTTNAPDTLVIHTQPHVRGRPRVGPTLGGNRPLSRSSEVLGKEAGIKRL